MKNKKTLIAALILVIVSLVGFIIFDNYIKDEKSNPGENITQATVNKKLEPQNKDVVAKNVILENQVFNGENVLTNYFKNKGYGKLVSLKLNNKFVDNIENDNISLYTGGIDNGCVDSFCGGPTFVAVVSENNKSVVYFESTIGDFECKSVSTIKNENVRNYVKENFCGI